MAYLPKNKYKIKYTNGGEFRLAKSSKEYVGNYIELLDGKVFAGDNILNPKGKLIPINKNIGRNVRMNSVNNRIYSILQPTLTGKQDTYIPILTSSPHPTEQNYQKGFFLRYFYVRVNTKQIYEIDKSTYDNFYKRKYNIKLNRPFLIRWSLTENSELENTNTLRKHNFQIPGIFEYFPNKAQYRRNNPGNPGVIENLVAQENELFFLDGTPYPAGLLYHIHPEKGPMEGGNHIPETHALLSFSSIPQIPDSQETSNGGSGY
tara:strand:+ start:3451 stop:4236 length:786 start_codon:yes stop_codon:yes gene_type:complete